MTEDKSRMDKSLQTDCQPEVLVVVDCQHDFVDGTLACAHAEEAVETIVRFINEHPGLPVYYSADDHSPSNQSFAVNGGTWPVHCVHGTRGAAIVEAFDKVRDPERRPGPKTLFYKGQDDVVEEYSAFAARREDGAVLNEICPKRVLVCGIASEFCVRETCLALQKAGFDVSLLVPGTAWVDESGHLENLEDLKKRKIQFCE